MEKDRIRGILTRGGLSVDFSAVCRSLCPFLLKKKSGMIIMPVDWIAIF
ncbi:hypothetical protein SD77_1745 [Bacillus badius]|uniref:Ribose 5-phosphate isomerase B n=1 Tax=Bacillus badius TaxID=1455 RepID=A0ABR5AQW3_BACBA|nr:hypothetical protein SD78_4225 [Bacillus badius]KIL77140.1 hypothetical protein SD77_1745 [Bacillus badius]